MLEVEPFWQLAQQMGRQAFVSRHFGWYLLKHPAQVGVVPKGELGWHTVAVSVEGDEIADPFPGEWRMIEIRKRPGNPFPDRIGVGRAQNCDIVLRLPFISKLHAHFVQGGGADPRAGSGGAPAPHSSMAYLRVVDSRSANGTSVNGRDLAPGEAAEATSGDWIGFGPLRLQLLDASDLFDTLQQRA
jgi:hypothetical protein